LFATIGYADQESTGSRTRPHFEKESQSFRAELRNAGFLNPYKNNTVFQSLDGITELSESLKSFSNLAQGRRINFIKEKIISGKSSGIICPIPITAEEEMKQSDERSLSKNELLSVIRILIGSLDQSKRPQFQGLKAKNKDQLLTILQQVQDIHNGNET